ncbi:MAG: AAA family ATPase, partial [Anaerotignum sp.]|nr:AAA family ATPase [Anaerotignum sp.]
MMDYQDLLICFDGVKMRGSNRAMCKCPCHHDKKASLSIDKIGDKILLHCFAGCKSEDILAAVGLTFSDLSPNAEKRTYIDKLEHNKGKPISAIYKYYDENEKYLYEKIRFHDKDMLIGIYDHSTEYFQYGLNGRQKTLFHLPQLIKGIAARERIFYVEGEKDVLTLESMGLIATTAGSANDWKPEYSLYFKNADVVILPDNDEPGQALAEKITKDMKNVAARTLIVKTADIPKGDVTDYIQEGHTKEDLLQLIQTAEKKIKNKVKKSSGLSLDMVNMEDIEEKPPEWLIPGYIPKRNITTMAGDGGSGKTTVWCEIAASISSGRPCFLTKESIPETFQQGPGKKVFFFSAEDSAESILKGRLRENNAMMPNILTIDMKDERFQHIQFDSNFLEELIIEHKPVLLIFDPLQAFIPPHIRMCDRNAMRSCMRPLISLGEKYDC